jgi:hypothetical protein
MSRGLGRSGARSAARAHRPATARRSLKARHLGQGSAKRGGKQVTKCHFVTSASNLLIMPDKPTRTQRKHGRQLSKRAAGRGRLIRQRLYSMTTRPPTQ